MDPFTVLMLIVIAICVVFIIRNRRDQLNPGGSEKARIASAVKKEGFESQLKTLGNFRTNRETEFPQWLVASISRHQSSADPILMVVTDPRISWAGALLVFEDKCMIVKGGVMGGLMTGSLGGERAATFFHNQITGIEYNSGMLTGVLEILTASYQGSANKDYWRGTGSSRNADSNDPWTLSNTLPLNKIAHESARPLLDELRKLISGSRKQKAVKVVIDAPKSVAKELTKLSDLRDKGIMTEAEFTKAKKRLLS